MNTTPIIVSPSLSRAEFAALHNVHPDTVKGWLAAGKVSGATKDSTGKWVIPADATVLMGQQSTVLDTRPVPSASEVATSAPAPEPKGSRFGEVVTLDAVAKEMGVSRGTVERLLADGLLPYSEVKGDHGASAIFVPPTVQ